MIKEYRIGNLVGTFKPHKVNGIYLSHFTATDANGLQQNSQQYNLLPIPLTPAILEKVGFENGYFGEAIQWADGEILIRCDHGVIDHRVDCKYLHQLQNFWFVYLGEELEINL